MTPRIQQTVLAFALAVVTPVSAQQGVDLVIANGDRPRTLDPHQTAGIPEQRIVNALFEGLTTLHPKTLAPQPGVAATWTVSKDRLTYTFSLRANARWSNGKPVTAEDFRRSWLRALDPQTACPFPYPFYVVKGAEAFNKQKAQGTTVPPSTVGVRVLGARQLQVTLVRPTPYFLQLTASPTLMPVRTPPAQGARVTSNGAFTLDTWEKDGRIRIVRSTTYWDRDRVSLSGVLFLPEADAERSYQAFRQGQVHWVPTVPSARLKEAKTLKQYYSNLYWGTYFYRLNLTRKPLRSVHVRKALSAAIDRRWITKNILRAGQAPTTGFTPPHVGWKGLAGQGFDPKQARRLFEKAGYPNGKGFPALELRYNTSASHKAIAERVVADWKKHLGIRVTLKARDWEPFLEDVRNKRYDIARAGWIGDYPDALTFLDMFRSKGVNNSTGWASKQYDALLHGAARELDTAKRLQVLRKAEALLLAEQPILPIYWYVNQGLLDERVGGWHANVLDLHPLKHLSLSRKF